MRFLHCSGQLCRAGDWVHLLKMFLSCGRPQGRGSHDVAGLTGFFIDFKESSSRHSGRAVGWREHSEPTRGWLVGFVSGCVSLVVERILFLRPHSHGPWLPAPFLGCPHFRHDADNPPEFLGSPLFGPRTRRGLWRVDWTFRTVKMPPTESRTPCKGVLACYWTAVQLAQIVKELVFFLK